MGAGSSVESIRELERDLPNHNMPMDQQEVNRVFGPAIANMKLFDALKDENGKITVKEVKGLVGQVKRINEDRRAAKIVANEGVGGKAKERLVKDLQMKEMEIKQIEQEKLAFKKQMTEVSESAGSRPTTMSANAVRENAARLAELESRQAELTREFKDQNKQILNVRKQEVAKRVAERQERGAAIISATVGKTAFDFTPKGGGGGGGGGGGRTPATFAYLADAGAQHKNPHMTKSMSKQFQEYDARQTRRHQRYSDEERD